MLLKNKIHEALSEGVIGCGMQVHTKIGPGVLESIYEACPIVELKHEGFRVDVGRRVPLFYREQNQGVEFVPDLIVNDTLIVEIKAVEALIPLHRSQVITYLKLTGLPVGLLMNFNVVHLRQGIRRIVHPEHYKK